LDSAAATILAAAIAADRVTLARRIDALREARARPAWGDDDALNDHVATCIHHWYGAAESVLERVVRAFEGSVPAGERWHNELLDQAALELPGIRAAVLRDPTRDALRKVLAFRHFFRHAYAVSWERDRLELAVADCLSAAPLLDADLDALLARLTAA